MSTVEKILVIVLAWERPIYLWKTLDSLYRHTRHPARFVIVDNGSKHPMVREVINGFDRRGMFERVILAEDNDPTRLQQVVRDLGESLPERFVFVEGDIEVFDSDPDWLSELVAISDDDPAIAYLGSLIDARDFVSAEAARSLEPDLNADALVALAKLHSPERGYPQGSGLPRFLGDLQPPGRLCLYRSEAVTRLGIRTDAQFTHAVRAAGWKAGIAARVRHRHLSLLHIFDEPQYDTAARSAFFTRIDQSAPL